MTDCRTCIYRMSLNGGHANQSNGEIACGYILFNGSRRPCPPPPKCTQYQRGRARNMRLTVC